MKVNQLLAIVSTMVIAMMGSAFAADAKEVTYQATMTGVT